MSDQPTDPTTRSPMPLAVPPDSRPSADAPPPSAEASPPAYAAPLPPAEPPPAATAPPTWRHAPPRDDGRAGSTVFGLIVLGLGVWFFASETLRLEMPDIAWRQAWPLILIAVGAWIVLGTLRRRP